MARSFKKDQSKIRSFNWLLMAKKGIRERICHSAYQYAKANNKYMKSHDKNKESSYFQYWGVNNYVIW